MKSAEWIAMRKHSHSLSALYFSKIKAAGFTHFAKSYCTMKPAIITGNGQTVIVYIEKLAKALLCLSESWREIILMRYYLQLRDWQIGALLGKPRTTVNYQKNAALKQLRTEMEKMNDEK